MPFQVESDARLAADVGTPAQKIPLTGVPGMGSRVAPYLLPPNPWQFLLAAGRATAAIFSPVRELFVVSSHWAIVRWFWAFDWSSTQVALSPHAEQIRNHHRIAFSEALGLAAGLLVVEHIARETTPPEIWRGGPMLVDVDSFVSSGQRPDLLILFGGPVQETFVLEAKGNRSGRSYSIGQLRKGIPQTLAAPGSARRLVVSAAAPGPDLDVQAVSVKAPTVRSDRLVAASEERDQRRSFGRELKRLISFAGGAEPGSGARPLIDPVLGTELIGRQLTIPGENLQARLTMGVDREIFDRLPEVGSIAELAELRSRVNRRHAQTDDGEAPPLAETTRAAAIAPDGCALSVELR